MRPARTFDGAAAWQRLSAEQQRKIGALALELIAAERLFRLAEEGGRDAAMVERLADAATRRLVEALEAEGTFLPIWTKGEVPIPSRLGDWCRMCGCSELDACAGGCGWVKPGLCTGCVPRVINAPVAGRAASGGDGRRAEREQT